MPRYRIVARGHCSKPDLDIQVDAYDPKRVKGYPFVVVHLLQRVSVEAIQQRFADEQVRQ